MEEANAQDEEVTITLPAATYTLTTNTQIEVTNADHPIAIEGEGADTTIIDGNEGTRIFNVAADANLSIDAVTLRNASAADDGGAIYNAGTVNLTNGLFEGNTAGDQGGAVQNDGILNVTNTTFLDNEAQGTSEGAGGAINSGPGDELSVAGSLFEGNRGSHDGGAIWIGGNGDVDIQTTTFRNNASDGHGGAIRNFGILTTITSSAFEENSSGSDDATDSGGAIYNSSGGEGTPGLVVTDSTFRDNVAPADESYGGAIDNDGGDAEVFTSTLVGNEAHEGGGLSNRNVAATDLTNVTISGNTSAVGGGIYTGRSASVQLVHVTVARNAAEAGDGSGGGISSTASNVNLVHSLFAENTPENCAVEAESFFSIEHNVFDDESCPSDPETDRVVENAQITDLGDYGGDTPVHALVHGSPAIDVLEPDTAEEDEFCRDETFEGQLEEDQRGAPRRVDGDDSGIAYCDAGAFEFVRPDSLTLAPADATNETDTEHTVTATVTDTLDAPSESITVRFAVSGANSDSGAAVTDANGEASFTYTGPNAGDDTIEAYADTDGDETQDEGEPSDTAAKTWQEPPEEPAGETVRLGGETRWETAIEISGNRFADGSADTVVLARGDDPDGYADALAGTPLAVCKGAPLLITTPDELLPEVADEIERVLGDTGTVLLLGLTNALDESVEASVEGLGYTTDRIGGAERIETSIDIANRIESECYTPANVMIARAFEFADALTGGAAASSTDGVIVLNQDDSRNDRVESYIGDHGDAALYALGGQIADLYPEAEGLFGTGRVETSVEVATEFFTGPTTVGFARAGEFPDSFTGGAHIGAIGGPMLLTQDAAESERLGRPLDPAAGDYLCTNSDTIATASIYGGVVAISADTETAIADRISGQGC